MDTLPNELARKIFEETLTSPFRRLVLSNVKLSPAYYSPVFKLWTNLDGVRLRDGSFAVSIDIDSLPKDGVIYAESSDEDEVDDDSMRDDPSIFRVDPSMKHICMYNMYGNVLATPIGTLNRQMHAMKSPLSAVCKLFRNFTHPCVQTTCGVPSKQCITLNDGDNGCEVKHTIILTDESDSDGVLAYYQKKALENALFGESDSDSDVD